MVLARHSAGSTTLALQVTERANGKVPVLLVAMTTSCAAHVAASLHFAPESELTPTAPFVTPEGVVATVFDLTEAPRASFEACLN